MPGAPAATTAPAAPSACAGAATKKDRKIQGHEEFKAGSQFPGKIAAWQTPFLSLVR
jgi:hypothetical protein